MIVLHVFWYELFSFLSAHAGENQKIGSLSTKRSCARTATGREPFFLVFCFDTTSFMLPSILPWKINVKTERKQKYKTFNWLIEQKQTSANFHWLSKRWYNNVISPWKFLESDRYFALTPFEMQYCDWGIELFTANIRSFLGGNKEKLCFNLAKHWSVKLIGNTFSRS